MVMTIDTAWFSSGSASGGNSTSTTGPAMATTRPVLSSGSVTVIFGLLLQLGYGDAYGRLFDTGKRGLVAAARGQGLGATDDLDGLGGDGVLAGSVHDPGEVGDEFLGVVGGGLHGPLARRLLRCRGIQERGVHARFHVAREQCLQDRARIG